jgi:hypothetical protein
MKVTRTPLILTAMAVLLISEAAPSWSAGSSAPSTSDVLSKMEVRLLDHDYKSETEDQRLARLEKFVFGGPESGTEKERIDRLKAAIVPAPSQTASSPAAVSKNASKPAGKDSPVASVKPQPAASYDPSDFGSYPRVAELEQQLFNKTFKSDPLPVRVARLETKEFGKTSPNEDLCDRMDRLDLVALKPAPNSNAPTAVASAPNYPQTYGPDGTPAPPGQHWVQYGSVPNLMPFNRFADANSKYPADPDEPAKPVIENPFAPGATKINGVEQRTLTLEKFVFGHEHAGKPIAERVAKLEKKLVPYEHNEDKDIATRVDHLWTMLNAANTMNKSPISTN